MTFKELITEFCTTQTQTVFIIPKGDVDLEEIKKELQYGHYWTMDINASNSIPKFPAELYAETAAFNAERELPGIDIVIKSDQDFTAFWKTHTRNKSIKF